MIEFDEVLRSRIAANLARHDRLEIALDGRRPAAVAILLIDSVAGSDSVDPFHSMTDVAGGAAFVLCRRSAGLNRHASQWALPGGRLDEGETAIDAALRETDEEVGVRLDRESVLGLLDDYPTRSGYVITPVVVWGGPDVVLVPHPDEVHAAYRVGVHQLVRDDSPRFVTIPESERPVVQVPIGGDLIHAPTGALLVQFRWVALDGRVNERVHDFEQPVFAWG